jgi:hypothetical protein
MLEIGINHYLACLVMNATQMELEKSQNVKIKYQIC